MDKATLLAGIAKLAKAGEQAGFTIEQLIALLNAGVGVECLIEPIAWRLEQPRPLAPIVSSSGWPV